MDRKKRKWDDKKQKGVEEGSDGNKRQLRFWAS